MKEKTTEKEYLFSPAETFIRQKFDIKVMPNELTFFHERLFEIMEEFTASQIDESINRVCP